MPRVTKPLSDTEIRKAKPRDKVYSLADGEGLQLRIKPNGSKLWLLDYYRPYTKKRTSLSFGNYPEVSLAQARQKRREARVLLAQDIDPQEHREEQARAIELAYSHTLENIAANWLEVKKGKMPLQSYALIHRKAKLSEEQKASLISWTESLSEKILTGE